MKDNYKNAGADYTGKTVSPTGTVTLVSDTVKIEANKDSVVRSKSFSVTVTGKPQTTYYLWVKGTNSMDSTYDNQPPMINVNQQKVYFDNDVTQASAGITPIGDYKYENGAGLTIVQDVATGGINVFNSTRYYALINTSTSGTSTVEWVTNNWTKAQKYTIRVEQNFPTDANGYGAAYRYLAPSRKTKLTSTSRRAQSPSSQQATSPTTSAKRSSSPVPTPRPTRPTCSSSAPTCPHRVR